MILSPASLVSKYDYKEILTPLVEDLQKIRTLGIKAPFQGVDHRLFGSLSKFVADNSAVHALGGVFCRFSTVKRFCRFCNCRKNELHEHLPINNFVLRTKKGYEGNMQSLELYPNFSSIYGIKCNSRLHSLKFVHVHIRAAPRFSTRHIRKFASDFISNIIKHCTLLQYFTLDELNDVILTFPCSTNDKSNKPQTIRLASVNDFKLTAFDMCNFLRLFPLIVGHLVCKTDEKWILLIDFLEIAEDLCAKEYDDTQLGVLEVLPETFFSDLSKKFSDQELKPKAHFLQYYPKMIEKFGSLIKTLRFEAKHCYFKIAFYGNKNRKDICLKLAKRHQMSIYLDNIEVNLFNHKNSQGIVTKEMVVEALDQPVYNVLTER